MLNDFELHILQFGCKYGIISTKLTLYVCEMIANGKVADMQYLRLLKALNDFFDKDEILTVLVTHMIRKSWLDQNTQNCTRREFCVDSALHACMNFI